MRDGSRDGRGSPDEDLLARLREVADSVDPMPEHVLRAATEAYGSKKTLAERATDGAVDTGAEPGK